jgi:1-acyl-sn-glycerol-3-phosphate acyltransferase
MMCLLALVVSIFSSHKNLVHHYCAVPWAKVILIVCGVKLRIKYLEDIEKDRPHIFMSNHQSYFDIFTLLAGLPEDFRFILKKELMRIPILGITMKRAGYISIDRGDTRNAIKSMDMAVEKIINGASVLVFPEGTRSKDGAVRQFKKGGFHMALRSGCELVPVAIVNSRKIVSKGSLRINRGTIDLVIGRPISVKNYSKRDIGILINRVRDAVIGQMEEVGGTER